MKGNIDEKYNINFYCEIQFFKLYRKIFLNRSSIITETRTSVSVTFHPRRTRTRSSVRVSQLAGRWICSTTAKTRFFYFKGKPANLENAIEKFCMMIFKTCITTTHACTIIILNSISYLLTQLRGPICPKVLYVV